MGRGSGLLLDIIDSALAPNCKWCNNKIKNRYWYNEHIPGLKFCKKSCLNKYMKQDAKAKDEGCTLCGKKNPSLRYHLNEKKPNVGQYCTSKHATIAANNPIILEIKYN